MDRLSPEAAKVLRDGLSGEVVPTAAKSRVAQGVAAAVAAGTVTAAAMAQAAVGAVGGAAATGAPVSAATGVSAASLLLGGVAGKVVAGLVVVGAVTTAGVWLSTRSREPSSTHVVTPAPVDTPASSAVAPRSIAAVVEDSPPCDASRTTTSRRPCGSPPTDMQRPTTASPPVPKEPVSPRLGTAAASVSTAALNQETDLLRRAQLALARTDGQREALALLAEHARRFPNGVLRRERLAAEVIARCNLGELETARAAAAEFVAEFPEGPLTERVKASCVTRAPVQPSRHSPP
jgi:hypothetical protein